jgi:hypothetical protein
MIKYHIHEIKSQFGTVSYKSKRAPSGANRRGALFKHALRQGTIEGYLEHRIENCDCSTATDLIANKLVDSQENNFPAFEHHSKSTPKRQNV